MKLTKNLEKGRAGTELHLDNYSEITDDELAILAEWPWTVLELDCTNINDDRLRLLHPAGSARRDVDQFGVTNATQLTNAAIEFIGWAFNTVPMLSLEGCTRCNDDGIALCCDVAGLKDLTLDRWETDGAGLANLLRLGVFESLAVINHLKFDSDNLRHLHGILIHTLCLMGSKIHEGHLHHLWKIMELIDLDLTSTGFSDEGMKAVSWLVNLQSLKFEEDATVSDEGFKLLKRIRHLKHLVACCPGVTDDGAQTVLELPCLEKLRFRGARITNKTVDLLPGCGQLVWLDLHDCQGVTDGAEEALAKMAQLQRLNLRGTSISPEAAERLRTALPKTNVKFSANLGW